MNKINYTHLIDEADVYSVAKKSPLNHALIISSKLNNKILLKREDMQRTFSFKVRGAINKINQLNKEDLENGVVCSSAGNHAQGVALASQMHKTQAFIVMPQTTPSIKIDAVKSLGANVILYGDNYDEAFKKAKELEKEKSLIFLKSLSLS